MPVRRAHGDGARTGATPGYMLRGEPGSLSSAARDLTLRRRRSRLAGVFLVYHRPSRCQAYLGTRTWDRRLDLESTRTSDGLDVPDDVTISIGPRL